MREICRLNKALYLQMLIFVYTRSEALAKIQKYKILIFFRQFFTHTFRVRKLRAIFSSEMYYTPYRHETFTKDKT